METGKLFLSPRSSQTEKVMFGPPRIARFYGGATAAISLEFDDGMRSQVEHAIPLLRAHRIRATFFVNPGVDHYPAVRTAFETDAVRAGHEIGNHTWTHLGAQSAEELEDQIHRCAKALAHVSGSRPRLQSFARPGGVPWEVSPEEEQRVFSRYRLLPATGRLFFGDPVAHVRAAHRQGIWQRICFHGVGDEWLPIDLPTFSALLRELKRRPELWIAPSIEIAKYIAERDAAKPLRLRDVSPHGFSLRVDSDPRRLPAFGLPVNALWDQELTVEVEVPSSWRRFEVRQLVRRRLYRVGNERLARFAVRPNRGPAHVARRP